MEQKIKHGSILFYREDKQWGFLRDKATNDEYFYHSTGVLNGFIPQTGDLVTFILGEGKRGPLAKEVTKISYI